MLSIIKVVFWAVLIMLTYLFLAPQNYLIPDIFDWWDKLQHTTAFMVLTVLALGGYGQNKIKVTFLTLALSIYGVCIEVLQSVSGWRYGDCGDWIADVFGISIGLTAFTLLQKKLYKRH